MNKKLLSLLVALVAMFGCLGSVQAQTIYKGAQYENGKKYFVMNVDKSSFVSGDKTTSKDIKDALVFTCKVTTNNEYLYTNDENRALRADESGMGNIPGEFLGSGRRLRITQRSNANGDYLYYIKSNAVGVGIEGDGPYLGDDGNGNLNKKNNGKNNNSYTWRLLPVTEANLAVSGQAHYGTFVAPFDVTLPKNVTAYKVTSIVDNDAKIESIGTTVPANTPVILNNSTDALITQTYYGYAIGTPNANGNDYLIGVYEDGTVSSNDGYILQYKDNECVFLKGNDQSIVKNRAYLNASKVPTDAKIRMVFAGEVTSISCVETSESIAAIYSISGAKLDKMQKGVNIVKMSNGTVKKVIVK